MYPAMAAATEKTTWTRVQCRRTGWTMPAKAVTSLPVDRNPGPKITRSTPTLPSDPETLSPAGPG